MYNKNTKVFSLSTDKFCKSQTACYEKKSFENVKSCVTKKKLVNLNKIAVDF